jgi:hypothetical protein
LKTCKGALITKAANRLTTMSRKTLRSTVQVGMKL